MSAHTFGRSTALAAGLLSAGVLAAAVGPSAAAAEVAAPPCDRTCLKGFADQLLTSIVAHDPSVLPLAHTYGATENSVASALDMMVIWRTATAAKGRYYVIDPVSQQVFLMATLAEGPNDTLLFGRIKVEAGAFSEIELYTNRSRGQGGFQFGPDGPGHMPDAWTVPLRPDQRASRAELLKDGRSIFDTSIEAPPTAASCVIMENGKVVEENPDVAKQISGAPPGEERPRNPNGSVSVPCGAPPQRPTDKTARTDIIDEEQGVVVSFASVQGVAEPYLATTPTQSAFVPYAMRKVYTDMLAAQLAAGVNKSPAIREMSAAGMTAQVNRIFDGKLQGMQLLVNIGAPGGTSPWVGR